MESVDPAAPIPPAPPQPAVQPAASNKFFWLSSGLAILTLGIAIGIFSAKFLNQSPNLSQLTSTPTPAPSPQSPTPTPDLYREPNGSAATADWKIYTNEALGFSLLYPQELNFIYDQVKEYVEGKAPSGNLLLENFDGSGPRQELSSDFQIAIFVSKDDQTSLEQLAKNTESQTVSPITMAGKTALKGTSIQKYKPVPTVWLRHSGHLFTIQLSTPQSTNSFWFDQILSTFKFLD